MLDARMTRSQAAVAREERKARRARPVTDTRANIQQMTMALPRHIHSQFDEIANKLGTTRGELARNLIAQFVRGYNESNVANFGPIVWPSISP